MATTDVFNNPANNYVNPNLSVCEGTGAGTNLEFLSDKSIAIVQGTDILESISFADIKIPVGSFTSNRKVLEPGEIIFIQGLAKGLDYRSQSFTLPNFVDNIKNPYFMVVDLSVGFYKNFRYYLFDIEASANYTNNISIDAALNVALLNIQSKITAAYDPSDLSFTGTQLGWDFNISNVELTLIDTSENALSPFNNLGGPQIFNLEEDLSKMVLYAKYPNSAMQGIIMKITYPPLASTPTMSIYDEWIYVSHVPDIVTIFEPIQINNFIKDLGLIITFDPSIKFGPFTGGIPATMTGLDVSDGSASNQFAIDCSFATYDLADSSLYNSRLNLTSTLLNGVLENSWINKDYPLLPYGYPSSRVEIASSIINDCSIANALITDTSIFKSLLADVSLSNCVLYNCSYDPSTISLYNCKIVRINETIDPSLVYDSSIYYQPVIKSIEVGMSGCSNLSTMTAGDYLQWITDNENWQKIGEIYIWLSTPDYDDTKNLIDGFYAFNPHDFPVQLEYMTVV
jgi:hypothetical protein